MTENLHSDRAGDAGATLRRPSEDDHEDTNSARQAAEALFAPKSWGTEPSALASTLSAEQRPRRPRILSAVPAQSTRVEAIEAPVTREPPKPCQKIPASHLARIRTWLKYGMTIPQLAKVYGVTSSDIERMLRKS